MTNSIGVSLKALVQETYQVLQRRYEDCAPNQESNVSELLYLHINNLSGFLEKGSVYVLSGCTPARNREAIIDATYGIIKDNEEVSTALVFLMKTEMQDWMQQMLSKYSSIPMSRIQSGAFNSDDWRHLAAATGEMAEEDIRVVAVVDEDELFRDADCFLKEGKLCDYIFIDSMYMINDNVVKLKQLALDFDSTIVVSSRSFQDLEIPEIRKVV